MAQTPPTAAPDPVAADLPLLDDRQAEGFLLALQQYRSFFQRLLAT